MEKQLVGLHYGSYTFDPANQQVILTDLADLSLNQVLLITNVTTGTIIYNFADPAKTGSITGNVLTLTYDVSSMNASDILMIYIQYPPKLLPKTYDLLSQTSVAIGESAVIFDSSTYNIKSGQCDLIAVKVTHMGFDIEVEVDGLQSYRLSLKELQVDFKMQETRTSVWTNDDATQFIDTRPFSFYKSLKITAYNAFPWFGSGTINAVMLRANVVI